MTNTFSIGVVMGGSSFKEWLAIINPMAQSALTYSIPLLD